MMWGDPYFLGISALFYEIPYEPDEATYETILRGIKTACEDFAYETGQPIPPVLSEIREGRSYTIILGTGHLRGVFRNYSGYSRDLLTSCYSADLQRCELQHGHRLEKAIVIEPERSSFETVLHKLTAIFKRKGEA